MLKNCFGCIGLKRAEHCILNKQYSPSDYETLAPKIIEHMQRTGEWGEFFPVAASPFAYNETIAQEYYPLTEAQTRAMGWRWRAEEFAAPAASLKSPPNLPIVSIPDDVITSTFACAESGRAFKVIKPELALYRKLGVPLPRFSHQSRHLRRTRLRAPRKLVPQQCAHCKGDIESTIDPASGAMVLCERCFAAQRYGG